MARMSRQTRSMRSKAKGCGLFASPILGGNRWHKYRIETQTTLAPYVFEAAARTR